MRFNGSNYDHEIDSNRLSEQHIRVKKLMSDQSWRTLKEIAVETGDPEASISAQLRHLKKKRFGSNVVEKRPRGDRSVGLYEYRVMPFGHETKYPETKRRNKIKEALIAVRKHKDFTEEMERLVKSILK